MYAVETDRSCVALELDGLHPVICLEFPDERMPIWTPLSPPVSDADDDLYYDACGDLWYEREPMSESRLPATIHELHRPRPFVPIPPTSTLTSAPAPIPSLLPFVPPPSATVLLSTPRQHLQQPVGESLLPATSSSTLLSAAATLGNSSVPPPIVAAPVVSEIRASSLLGAPPTTISQERERVVNTVPQTGVTSGAPYLDTSNLLRPATPSRIPNSVDGTIIWYITDAIDSVRKSAQKSSSFAGVVRSYDGSSRSLFSDGRGMKSDMRRPLTPPPREREAADYEGPEWNINEDYALLLAVAQEQHLPYHLHSSKPGHIVNWDFVSQLMARYTSFFSFRSPRQCSIHYQLVVQPREEGRMMTLDPVTKKSRKVPVSSIELRSRNLITLSGRLPPGQEMKLSEFGIRYQNTLLASDLVEYREERRARLHEQEKERQRIKEEEERQKEIAVEFYVAAEQQNEREQKVQKRESAVMALPGIITYQRTSMGSMLEQSQQQQQASVSTSAVSTTIGTVPVATVRTIGGNLQPNTVAVGSVTAQSVTTVGDSTQVIVGQRALSDHQQMASLPSISTGVHHAGARRVQIPTASGIQTQHQIVMTGSTQIGQATTQQPYTVVVSSQDNIKAANGIAIEGLDFFFDLQLPVAYASTSSGQPTQIYSTASHCGRALIVSQTADAQTLGEQPQLQMMRPQLQPVGAAGVRQDVRPKIAQRTQNRVYLTTSGGERTYLMPQSQVRMLPSGQRITQKRTATTLQGKTLAGQQQVRSVI
ncbi:unnamed protein product [Toxocara canis]|uniref:SANT domain-containing protein n=1 Tax=Toxocara canis TaxID=6265 RepID=A0A183UIQ7_TOXCA|nr:unnamed protein product [Toxocara canis]